MEKNKVLHFQQLDLRVELTLRSTRAVGPNKLGKKALKEALALINLEDLVHLPRCLDQLCRMLGAGDPQVSTKWYSAVIEIFGDEAKCYFDLARGIILAKYGQETNNRLALVFKSLNVLGEHRNRAKAA